MNVVIYNVAALIERSEYGFAYGYGNAMVSSPNAAEFAPGAEMAAVSGTFSLQSGYFTVAFNNGLQVTITGLLNGAVEGTDTFTISTSGPTLESLTRPRCLRRGAPRRSFGQPRHPVRRS